MSSFYFILFFSLKQSGILLLSTFFVLFLFSFLSFAWGRNDDIQKGCAQVCPRAPLALSQSGCGRPRVRPCSAQQQIPAPNWEWNNPAPVRAHTHTHTVWRVRTCLFIERPLIHLSPGRIRALWDILGPVFLFSCFFTLAFQQHNSFSSTTPPREKEPQVSLNSLAAAAAADVACVQIILGAQNGLVFRWWGVKLWHVSAQKNCGYKMNSSGYSYLTGLTTETDIYSVSKSFLIPWMLKHLLALLAWKWKAILAKGWSCLGLHVCVCFSLSLSSSAVP